MQQVGISLPFLFKRQLSILLVTFNKSSVENFLFEPTKLELGKVEGKIPAWNAKEIPKGEDMWLDNKRDKVQIGDNKEQFGSSGNRPGAWTEIQTTRGQKYNAMAGTNTDALTETRLSVVYLEARWTSGMVTQTLHSLMSVLSSKRMSIDPTFVSKQTKLKEYASIHEKEKGQGGYVT